MRKQERQVLENAITTINSALNCAIGKGEDFVNFKQYVSYTVNELIGYASIQHRFAGMSEEDFDEFCKCLFSFKTVIEDRINYVKEKI